jgi:hypothetical protein
MDFLNLFFIQTSNLQSYNKIGQLNLTIAKHMKILNRLFEIETCIVISVEIELLKLMVNNFATYLHFFTFISSNFTFTYIPPLTVLKRAKFIPILLHIASSGRKYFNNFLFCCEIETSFGFILKQCTTYWLPLTARGG